MKVDGKEIAREILEQLKSRVGESQKNNITPHLAVILVGDDPASVAYVNQKKRRGEEIGAKVTILSFPTTISQENLLATIQQLNDDKSVHGIIVQRPLPSHLDENALTLATNLQKDVDHFNPDSPYPMPVAAAVMAILENIFQSLQNTNQTFIEWLGSKQIAVIGKGSTGGLPTIEKLKELGVTPQVIDSKTENKEEITRSADIIICAVGKPGVLTAQMIKPGVILIGIGMQKGSDGKLQGDYDTEDIKDKASYFTAIPGGVGPVNVAMLLTNLLSASEHITDNVRK